MIVKKMKLIEVFCEGKCIARNLEEINLGQIKSLIHCNKCGMPNKIYLSQESINCENCKSKINLKFIM